MMDRRTLLMNGLSAGMLLPMHGLGLAQAAKAGDDPYLKYVHPDLRVIAARLLKMFAKQPDYSQVNMSAMRKSAAGYSRPPLADVPWRQRLVPGKAGDPDVSIVIVNDKPGESRPAILHIHGGGFIIGAAQNDLHEIQQLALKLDCVVVSVNYRLAPETTYAGSIEDNYAVLKWLYANANELGADRTRIAVYGGSAGGGHAALLAMTARDRGEVPIAFQCLIYPMLDDRTGSTRPVPAHVGKIIWTAQSNRFGWASFLGVEPGSSKVPVRAVPARTPSLAGLPPAFIGVGSIDLFHDEDVDFAQRLNDSGVSTELIVVPGAFHGFDSAGLGTPIVNWFNNAKEDAFRQALGLPPAKQSVSEPAQDKRGT